MKRANVVNEEACQSLLLKMRDEALRIFSRSFSMTLFTVQKRGLPMQLLRAFVHWDHESRPTAPFFAGVIHSCQSRQYVAVTVIALWLEIK
jgi:hypothetical protein